MNTYVIIKWVESQVGSIGHSNRGFMEHLFGTYDILRSWGEDIDLCYAGLCHSLYETESFKHESLRGKIQREQLADVIGSKAEFLVYLFCNMPNRWKNLSENTFQFPPDIHLNLLKLELANFIEQMDELENYTEERKKSVINDLIGLITKYEKDFKPKGINFD